MTVVFCDLDDLLDDVNNKNEYGVLYSGFATTATNLCPTGYRVSTRNDWETLKTYAGGTFVAGGKLKEAGTAHWLSSNSPGTDNYGFSAVGSGYISNLGAVGYLKERGYYWTSTAATNNNNWLYVFNYIWANLDFNNLSKDYGLPVRCIKN